MQSRNFHVCTCPAHDRIPSGLQQDTLSDRNLHPRVKVDQAGRPLPPKKT